MNYDQSIEIISLTRAIVPASKIQLLSECLGEGLSYEQIQKKMKISRGTLFNYKDALEEMVDNYAFFMMESGLLIKVKAGIERIEGLRAEYDELLKKAKEQKNPWFHLHTLQAYAANEKMIIDLLENAGIAKRMRGVIEKVAMTQKVPQAS